VVVLHERLSSSPIDVHPTWEIAAKALFALTEKRAWMQAVEEVGKRALKKRWWALTANKLMYWRSDEVTKDPIAFVALDGTTTIAAVPDSAKKKYIVELLNDAGVRIIKGKKKKKKDKEGEKKERKEKKKEDSDNEDEEKSSFKTGSTILVPRLELFVETEEEMREWVQILKVAVDRSRFYERLCTLCPGVDQYAKRPPVQSHTHLLESKHRRKNSSSSESEKSSDKEGRERKPTRKSSISDMKK